MGVGNRRAASAFLAPILTLLVCSVAYSQTVRAIADTAFLSVVLITMEDASGRRVGTASGFFIREDLVATNFHVIKTGTRGHVKLVGASEVYSIAGLVGMDQSKDLAILKIAGGKAPSLRFGSDADARVGDKIYAVGNPLGLEGTFSDGIISGVRRLGSRQLLQITAPISPGSSGGPVLNERGLVIGIAVATLTGGQNLNFAIPVSDLGPLLANIGRLFPLPGQAAVTRPAPTAKPAPTEKAAPTERPAPNAPNAAMAKEAENVLQATKNYRLALERVLDIYQRDLARREDQSKLYQDLYERGVLSKETYDAGELALAAARTNVKDARRAIEDTDLMIKEAEEALAIARGDQRKSR